MIYLRDPGHGITRESLEFFNRHRKQLGVIREVSCNARDPTGYSVRIVGDMGEMQLSGLNCGYGGEGPHGLYEVLTSIGAESRRFWETDISRHDRIRYVRWDSRDWTVETKFTEPSGTAGYAGIEDMRLWISELETAERRATDPRAKAEFRKAIVEAREKLKKETGERSNLGKGDSEEGADPNPKENPKGGRRIKPWSREETRLVEREVARAAKKHGISEFDLLADIADEMSQKHFYVDSPFTEDYYIKFIEKRARELKEG
jgi:hypothetical protein